MGFGDLTNDTGLNVLNEYLVDKSYIEGYQPSQADATIIAALSGAPSDKHINVARWFTHIKSFGDDTTKFPGVKKDAAEYGPVAPMVNGAAAAVNGPAADDDDSSDDSDVDLFGSDDEEAEKLKAERLAAYAAKKTAKPVLIAKSSILLDVKPWDDECDMKEIERLVREVQCDGLVWGVSKLITLAYGIKKLQIVCVVEDDKVSTDWLEEQITQHEDLIQSMDIAAFNKI